MTELSSTRQPDALPLAVDTRFPSLWIYAGILAVAAILIIGAFALQTKPDWPGLMLNVAAGLIASFVVLVFVDRKLRAQDLAAVRRLPAQTRLSLYGLPYDMFAGY